jgi:hypothetical protein
MCSTFKILLAVATLAKVDTGQEQLARRVRIKPSDILSYAPIAKEHVGATSRLASFGKRDDAERQYVRQSTACTAHVGASLKVESEPG